MDADGIEYRLSTLEKQVDQNAQYRHDMRGQIASVKTELAVVHTELNGLRVDQEEGQDRTEKRLQSISRWFMFAGTSFLALAGLVAGLLAQHG